jgi:deazaflavin-dependent oxidoreductase (nitroreductase family)
VSEMNDFNRQIIDEFRRNGGKVGGPFEGASLVLLTTKGAKTGRPRTHPLVCQVADDGTLFVFASKGGAPTNPDWYYNLLAHPQVGVEFGADSFEATADVVTGPQRDEIFTRQVERFPDFADYQDRAHRIIPVVALRRT